MSAKFPIREYQYVTNLGRCNPGSGEYAYAFLLAATADTGFLGGAMVPRSGAPLAVAPTPESLEVIAGFAAGVPPSDALAFGGLVTGCRGAADARVELVEEASAGRLSVEVAVLEGPAFCEIVLLDKALEAVEVPTADMRLLRPFIGFLASSPLVRDVFPSCSCEGVAFAVDVGRRTVVVPAEGRAGGLVKLLPAVVRVELVDVVFKWPVAARGDALLELELNLVGAETPGRLGAADVAVAGFFVGGMFSCLAPAAGVAVVAAGPGTGSTASFCGSGVSSTGSWASSTAIGTSWASTSAMVGMAVVWRWCCVKM